MPLSAYMLSALLWSAPSFVVGDGTDALLYGAGCVVWQAKGFFSKVIGTFDSVFETKQAKPYRIDLRKANFRPRAASAPNFDRDPARAFLPPPAKTNPRRVHNQNRTITAPIQNFGFWSD